MGNSEVSVWAWFKKEELGPTRMSDLISLCISRSHAIISVMGPHAGEQSDTIFQRKIGDISRIGWTLWLIKSYKAKPDRVQAMCRRTTPAYAVFIEAGSPGSARPAVLDAVATQYSADRRTWTSLPSDLGPVTGHLNSDAYALMFDKIEAYHRSAEIDLWDYSEFDPDNPEASHFLETKLGCSTVCAVRADSNTKKPGMKSRYRKVLACARLRAPSAVWVRR